MEFRYQNTNNSICTSAGTFNRNDDSCIVLNKGEILVVSEKSDYLRSTKLKFMGCLIYPKEGILEINGRNISLASTSEESDLLNLLSIGFIFYKHRLLEGINVEENVAIPLKFEKLKAEEIRRKTLEVLKSLNLFQFRKKMPKQLTNLERQQIIIARALVSNPEIIICDKPTAFLDRESAVYVMRKLQDLAKQGKTIIIINQEIRYNGYADRIVELKNGMINELVLV